MPEERRKSFRPINAIRDVIKTIRYERKVNKMFDNAAKPKNAGVKQR